MKVKKGIIIGLLVLAIVAIFIFVYMWSLGVFSGSDFMGERNSVMEQAVTARLSEKLEETFSDHESLKLVEAKSFAAMFVSTYPLEEYSDVEDISDDVLDEAIRKDSVNMTIELTFEGESLTFPQYKVLVYQVVETIRTKMEWAPLSMQIFYNRNASNGETENVMQYESRIPNYLFDKDQKTVVNASGVHYIVEADEELTTKTKIYFGVRNIYLVVVSITVVALTTLLIVRTVKKKRRYKK